jgi:hypothetical protein
MLCDEQEKLKTKYYTEAIRYMDIAKETLQKAERKGKLYEDENYVRTACRIAYNAVLKALDGHLYLKGVGKRKGRKSINYYFEKLAEQNKEMKPHLHAAYNVLYLDGYRDGIRDAGIIKRGFDIAYEIISKIKPLA